MMQINATRHDEVWCEIHINFKRCKSMQLCTVKFESRATIAKLMNCSFVHIKARKRMSQFCWFHVFVFQNTHKDWHTHTIVKAETEMFWVTKFWWFFFFELSFWVTEAFASLCIFDFCSFVFKKSTQSSKSEVAKTCRFLHMMRHGNRVCMMTETHFIIRKRHLKTHSLFESVWSESKKIETFFVKCNCLWCWSFSFAGLFSFLFFSFHPDYY